MRNTEKTCGTCVHKLNAEKGDYVCGNRESDLCTEFVFLDDTCENWEG